MGELIKRLFLVLLFLLGGLTVTLAWVQDGGAEQKKKTEVKTPPRKPLADDALITMDFQDVDLSVVIKFMGDLTGKNFLVSDQVRGKVTIISPRKITVREAYQVFESVLEMNGYSAVSGVDAIKIVPSGIARQSGLEIHEGKAAEAVKVEDKMITQVIPLEFASSEDIRNLFTPLISKDGMIASYKPTNHLIVTERSSNIYRLLKIIEQVDVRIVEEKFSYFPLEFASAKSLAEKLTQLLSPEQRPGTAARPPGPGATQRIVKIIPDERTNSLVVLASDSDTRELRELISRLDREAPKGRSQLHVYYLKHAQAEEMAKVLSAIVGAKAKARQQAQPPQPGVVEETSITADKATNSLVITASPQDFKDLEEIIQKLDGVRSQVLVEALIAEVSMTTALAIGVEWRIMDQPVPDAVRGLGGTDFGLITGVQTGTLQNPGLILGLAKGFITVGGVQVPNIGALVRAFQNNTDANVLSTPQLLTIDNEKAKIIVADNVPVIKQDVSTPLATTSTTTSNIAVSRTFEYKDIGIQLEITPHISSGSLVRLEITAEVSNILSSDPTNPGFVTTRKRQATTTVSVESGQMVIIGGLIQDNRTAVTNKVPCIGNIPGLGWLFKTFSGTKDKTNLLVFITPHIIRSPEDLEKATAVQKEKAEENLKKLQEQREKETEEIFDMLKK
jgi:general secretion pathway protein D